MPDKSTDNYDARETSRISIYGYSKLAICWHRLFRFKRHGPRSVENYQLDEPAD